MSETNGDESREVGEKPAGHRRGGAGKAEWRLVRDDNIVWMAKVEGRTNAEIGGMYGLRVDQVSKILKSRYSKLRGYEFENAIGQVREAALKRYGFELEGLLGKAIGRLRQLIEDEGTQPAVIVKAVNSILDRAGLVRTSHLEVSGQIELPEASLRRIEDAVRELPMLQDGEGETWRYAREKPEARRPQGEDTGETEAESDAGTRH